MINIVTNILTISYNNYYRIFARYIPYIHATSIFNRKPLIETAFD